MKSFAFISVEFHPVGFGSVLQAVKFTLNLDSVFCRVIATPPRFVSLADVKSIPSTPFPSRNGGEIQFRLHLKVNLPYSNLPK